MSNATNFSVLLTAPYPLFDNINYIILGVITLSLNLTIFAVLISNKSLLRRSALIAGIAVSNFFLGLHMLASGIYRLAYGILLWQSASYLTLSCLSLIFPVFYALAFNTEASFLILAGLERLLAMTFPNWFRNQWTPKNVWLLSLVAYVFVFGNVFINLLIPLPERVFLNWNCVPTIYGNSYILFLSGFSAAAGVVSALMTLTALIIGIRRIKALPLLSGESGRIKRQIQLTKSMATISCFEVALVVIPNLLTLMANLGFRLPSFIRSNNSTYTNAINSMVAFFAFVIFNGQFRKAAAKLLHAQKFVSIWKRLRGQQQVQPLPNARSQSQIVNTEGNKNVLVVAQAQTGGRKPVAHDHSNY